MRAPPCSNGKRPRESASHDPLPPLHHHRRVRHRRALPGHDSVGRMGARARLDDHAGGGLPAWFKFMATALLGALLGMAIVAMGVAWGWHYLAAQVLATLCSLVLTYAVNRRWTFG
jgi:hypothetical protein